MINYTPTGRHCAPRALQYLGRGEAGMVPSCRATLLDVVWAVSEYADTEAELVATVAFLVNSGAVQLCGTFTGARIDLSPAVYAAPHSVTPKG